MKNRRRPDEYLPTVAGLPPIRIRCAGLPESDITIVIDRTDVDSIDEFPIALNHYLSSST